MRVSVGALSCLCALVACSSDPIVSGGSDAGGDSANGGDSSVADSGGSDSGPALLNNCKPGDFVPANAIAWGFTVTPRCITVKAGDSVTWTGNFMTHPLDAFNGDAPNPISGNTPSNGTVVVKFPAAGNYGFHCKIHASMLGVVQVTP